MPRSSRASVDDLPADWQRAQIADVARVVAGGSLGLTKEHYRDDGFPAYSASGQDGFVERCEYEGCGVVLSSIGARCGRTFIAEGRWTTLANTQVIFPTQAINVGFLWQLTNDESYWHKSGSAQPFIRPRDIAGAWLPLPPLAEQKKIAAILSSLDEAIRANEAVIEQTRRVKEGLLQELLTRGIGHTEFRETEIGPLPVGWELVELGELADVRSGIAKSSGRQLRDRIEVPYLRVANVQDGYVDLREVKTIAIEREDLERYRLMSGDVLMNEGGDIDKLGRGDVWRGQVNPCVHQNHVFSVRCGARLRPEYLSFLAESSYGKRYFLEKGKQTTNLASINKTQLRAFPVPLPTVAEQDTIIDRLVGVRSVVDANLASVESLQRLKSGLLQDLLTGKVRVSP